MPRFRCLGKPLHVCGVFPFTSSYFTLQIKEPHETEEFDTPCISERDYPDTLLYWGNYEGLSLKCKYLDPYQASQNA